MAVADDVEILPEIRVPMPVEVDEIIPPTFIYEPSADPNNTYTVSILQCAGNNVQYTIPFAVAEPNTNTCGTAPTTSAIYQFQIRGVTECPYGDSDSSQLLWYALEKITDANSNIYYHRVFIEPSENPNTGLASTNIPAESANGSNYVLRTNESIEVSGVPDQEDPVSFRMYCVYDSSNTFLYAFFMQQPS